MSDPTTPTLSQDAAIVLALADTAVPFAVSPEDEAERWVRVLRLHGQVGCAMQALGVGEAPLESPAQARAAVRLLRRRELGDDIVQMVAQAANDLARRSGSPTVGTIHVLFAVLAVYDRAFDRALYVRGTTREELLERLASDAPLPQPRAV
jgi:glutathione S-transferase